MDKDLCGLFWLKRLLTKIGFALILEISFLCNYKDAKNISHDPIQYDKAKHVKIDRYVIKYNHETKIIQFSFVKSKYHLSDIVIKKIVSAKNSTAH